jgi:dTDP-4-dehydrorhamnose 3,5-epimerase
MLFQETELSGAFIIEPERFHDERGFFADVWSEEDFAKHGLSSRPVECSISFNYKRGTLRGMHYQAAPFGQAKLVRCTMGAVYDVIIDLRPGSSTFAKWTGVELTAENRRMLFIPKDFAHGFLTREDKSEVLYQMSDIYKPESSKGVRWDDPAFGIRWPEAVRIINDRDRNYPDLTGEVS